MSAYWSILARRSLKRRVSSRLNPWEFCPEIYTVDVRLPVSVLKMIPERSKAKPFETFEIFVDADERLSETDEENNILLLSRDAIKPLQSAETGKATSNQADAKTPEGTK